MIMHRGSIALFCQPDKAMDCVLKLLPIVKWEPESSSNPADVLIDIMTAYPLGVHAPADKENANAQLGTLFIEAVRSAELKAASRQLSGRPDKMNHLGALAPIVSHGRERWCHLFEAMWALESRTLAGSSLISLHFGSVRTLVAGLCIGFLYYRTTTLYSLIACLFINLKNSGNVWGLLVTGSFYQPHDSAYTLEVGAKAFSPTTYLISKYVHYSVFSLLSVVPTTALGYILTFYPNLNLIRYGYILLFTLLDLQVLLATTFLCSALTMFFGGSANAAYSGANLILETSAVFSGLYVLYGDTTWIFRWVFHLSYSYDAFRGMCRVAFENFVVPREQCTTGDAGCLLFRSGDNLLREFGYDDVDLVDLAISLVLQFVVTMMITVVLLEVNPRKAQLRRMWSRFTKRQRRRRQLIMHALAGPPAAADDDDSDGDDANRSERSLAAANLHVMKDPHLMEADSDFMASVSGAVITRDGAAQAAELISHCISFASEEPEKLSRLSTRL